MMTAETYLRRCLFAPILMPVLVCLAAYLGGAFDAPDSASPADKATQFAAIALGYTLLFGAVPYAWMLWDNRAELKNARGRRFEETVRRLPVTMLPYFWKFLGGLAVVVFVWCVGWAAFEHNAPPELISGLGFYAIAAIVILLCGTLSVFVAGYLYIGVTFAFLRLFQRAGLVEPTA